MPIVAKSPVPLPPFTSAKGRMVPWLPTNPRLVSGDAAKRSSLVKAAPLAMVAPSGETLPVPPMKLTVAPTLRARPALVSFDVAPGSGAAA